MKRVPILVAAAAVALAAGACSSEPDLPGWDRTRGSDPVVPSLPSLPALPQPSNAEPAPSARSTEPAPSAEPSDPAPPETPATGVSDRGYLVKQIGEEAGILVPDTGDLIVTLTVTAIAFAWFAAQTVLYTWNVNAHSNTTLAVPLVLPQALWLAGLVWFAITACWLTVRSVRHLLNRQSGRVSAEIGMLALQEELEDIPLEKTRAQDAPAPADATADSHA